MKVSYLPLHSGMLLQLPLAMQVAVSLPISARGGTHSKVIVSRKLEIFPGFKRR